MRRVWTGIDWLSRRLALWTNDAVPWLLIALLLSRHMRGGLAGAGTATMPRRHGITRPPTPLLGVESFLFATPTSFTSTCWIYLYHPKSSLVST
eukprot:COSAG01_NODE_2351_length_7852_cov_47.949955_7_plen_94_part_00